MYVRRREWNLMFVRPLTHELQIVIRSIKISNKRGIKALVRRRCDTYRDQHTIIYKHQTP